MEVVYSVKEKIKKNFIKKRKVVFITKSYIAK